MNLWTQEEALAFGSGTGRKIDFFFPERAGVPPDASDYQSQELA
jgi:hypothetical protein